MLAVESTELDGGTLEVVYILQLCVSAADICRTLMDEKSLGILSLQASYLVECQSGSLQFHRNVCCSS